MAWRSCSVWRASAAAGADTLRLLPLLILPATGLAWEHEGAAWSAGDAPIPWQVTSIAEDSLQPGDVQAAFKGAFAAWTDPACLAVDDAFSGAIPDNTGHKRDGTNLVSVDDPFDQVPVGTLALTVLSTEDTVVFEQDGVSYQRIVEADVVLNDEVEFARDADLDASCTDATSIDAVAAHEVGHWWGLAHACARGEDCEDALVDATMHWHVPPCDPAPSTLETDDLHGMAALYGPYVEWSCGPTLVVDGEERVFGTVPFTATCTAEHPELDAVSWDFGDGGSTTGSPGEHTYDTPGVYDITATFDAPGLEACPVFDASPARPGLVVACEQPDLAVSWEVIDGALIQLVNDSDEPPEGCFETVQWVIYAGPATSEVLDVLFEWEPAYEFPGPGDYRAVLEVSGPAGTASAETFPHVDSGGLEDTGVTGQGCRCATPAGPALPWIVILLAPGLRRRRRRGR